MTQKPTPEKNHITSDDSEEQLEIKKATGSFTKKIKAKQNTQLFYF